MINLIFTVHGPKTKQTKNAESWFINIQKRCELLGMRCFASFCVVSLFANDYLYFTALINNFAKYVFELLIEALHANF